MAMEGKSVSELLEAVFHAFDLRPNEEGIYHRFAAIACLKEAFSLTFRELEEIDGWHKFHKPGYTDEE
jgi:hypothetical protein